MASTYLTETVGLPASLMTNPWFVIIAFGCLAFFIIIIFFAMMTALISKQVK
jgi:hypothetical protein